MEKLEQNQFLQLNNNTIRELNSAKDVASSVVTLIKHELTDSRQTLNGLAFGEREEHGWFKYGQFTKY